MMFVYYCCLLTHYTKVSNFYYLVPGFLCNETFFHFCACVALNQFKSSSSATLNLPEKLTWAVSFSAPFYINNMSTEESTPIETTAAEQKPFDRELKILSPPKNAGPIRK